MEQSNDNSTIVSIVPFGINEEKPGIFPGRYTIPSVKVGVATLVVKPAFYYRPVPNGMPPIKVELTSSKVADSVVKDYISSQLGIGEGAYPGLTWVHGKHDSAKIEKDFPNLIDKLKDVQKAWFVNLVRLADDDWKRYHSHKVISDTQRFACTSLGLDREWNVSTVDTIECPACKSVQKPGTVICPNCKCVLDNVKFATMQFA